MFGFFLFSKNPTIFSSENILDISLDAKTEIIFNKKNFNFHQAGKTSPMLPTGV